MKLKPGDRITVKHAERCYYYDYPSGHNLVTLEPGDVATVAAIAPKVRMVKGPGHDNRQDFIVCDAKGQRFGINFVNAVRA